MTWQRIRAASWAPLMFRFTLVVSLKAIGARGLPSGGGVRVGALLQQFSGEQPLVQVLLAARHGHAWACKNSTPGQCVQHWRIIRGKGLAVLYGTSFLGRSLRWRSAMVCTCQDDLTNTTLCLNILLSLVIKSTIFLICPCDIFFTDFIIVMVGLIIIIFLGNKSIRSHLL